MIINAFEALIEDNSLHFINIEKIRGRGIQTIPRWIGPVNELHNFRIFA